MIPETNFDEHSVSYREKLKRSLGFFNKNEKFFDLIKINCIKEAVIQSENEYDILDFGCGIGKLTGLLAKEFQQSSICGYDISRESLAVAGKENIQIKNIYFSHKIPEDKMYDCIIAANVFHHIDVNGHMDTLKMIKQVLKPKGKAIIFEHNPFNPLTRYVVNTCPFDVDAKLIYLRNFIRMAEMSELKVEFGYYILFFPWQPKIFRKIEKYLRHIPFGAQYMLTLNNVESKV